MFNKIQQEIANATEVNIKKSQFHTYWFNFCD